MRIIKFSATGIHGYLSFEISFNNDLTFLTGINGSGKTTVIYSIVALISPSLLILSNLDFSWMRVEVEHDSKKLYIEARRNENGVSLSTSETDEPFIIPPFVPDPDAPAYRVNEEETQFYRNLVSEQSPNPVLQLINTLPTPMFLDLDRRARAQSDRYRPRPSYISRSMNRGRNIFNAPLSQSLAEAAQLAESRNHELTQQLLRLSDRLRREMLLTLLTMEERGFGPWEAGLATPTQQDLATIRVMRSTVPDLPRVLQLSPEDVHKRITPFLDKLENAAKMIPNDTDVNDLISRRRAPTELLSALVLWSSNQAQLRKLSEIVSAIQDYNRDRAELESEISKYLSLVNRFLKDSSKTVNFGVRGAVGYSIETLSDERPIISLSSGEAQIFVILTHLFFNPIAQQANVFVIDEPELSLHVQWQEHFVESVCAANPTVQYIMATHSPSIILDKVEKCWDMKEGKMIP